MAKYIVVRVNEHGKAKTRALLPFDSDNTLKVTDNHSVALDTRNWLAERFFNCQYDIIELYNWEPL